MVQKLPSQKTLKILIWASQIALLVICTYWYAQQPDNPAALIALLTSINGSFKWLSTQLEIQSQPSNLAG